MPVHNEEKFLSSSLPSIYDLKPSEVILIFDRCTDKSLEVAKKFSNTHHFNEITKFVEVIENNYNWKFRFSFLRCLGIDMASNDINLVTGADLVLDLKIANHISRIKHFPFISFSYIDIPINFTNLIQRLLSHLPLFKRDKLSGIYVVNRKVMDECEDREKLKQLDAAQDTFLHRSIQKRYPTDYVITNSIHLRPKNSPKRHYLQGRLYWKSGHRGFLKTALGAIVTCRFNLLKGYIHERSRS
jgi:glycosyltransferase involved in cell wall biosynthesis